MLTVPSNNIAIEFSHVTKKFTLQSQRTFKEFLPAFVGRKTTRQEFTALSDISFTINQGDSVGIIGPNGSGKSTILKLIAGVMTPTHGNIKVNGKISPLIELGAGMHSELTGKENIYLSGSILGLSQKDIDQRLDSIIEFSELRDFIDQPIKHYSSGMYMRLGFSVAVNVDPQILLIDEILAVGDISFQKKCLSKMSEFKNKGVTIFLVSHNLDSVRTFCSQAIYINHANLIAQGNVDHVSEIFTKDQNHVQP
jgi:ABC-type polysaccharide/polyol phosphate transport system ATPase subunit